MPTPAYVVHALMSHLLQSLPSCAAAFMSIADAGHVNPPGTVVAPVPVTRYVLLNNAALAELALVPASGIATSVAKLKLALVTLNDGVGVDGAPIPIVQCRKLARWKLASSKLVPSTMTSHNVASVKLAPLAFT